MAEHCCPSEHTFPLDIDIFRIMGTSGIVNSSDDYYYRVDALSEVKQINDGGFRLPRKLHTNTSDHMSLGDIFKGLPDNQGLFRLGWFTNWVATCRYIGAWKKDQEIIMVTRILKQDLESLPGIQICEDLDVLHYPMMGYPAVLTYVIESLESQEQELSRTIIPFNITDFLHNGTTWTRAT